jgi:S-adenosylmethionine:tRNA ribosyltransferase-isomerase
LPPIGAGRPFVDIINYLKKGDVLVINNTRVIPARLFGYIDRENSEIKNPNNVKTDTTKKVEILLLKRIDLTHWEAIAKPAKKLKIGIKVVFNDKLSCIIDDINENGIRIIDFKFNGVFEDILNDVGNVPLPPYITTELKDKERYQTVYNKIEGSSAAPTAGLHFTDELLLKLKEKGIIIVEILLHVGLSTFRPVKEDKIENHKMHTEYYEVSKEAADTINKAKIEGRRIISVGTTSVRTLESVCNEKGLIKNGSGYTDIFIYPPYKFKVVDALITNFHLPESTLIMLVSAFAGLDKTMNMYKVAVENKYRFFSFGDATFIY